jgi:hypothetical protein
MEKIPFIHEINTFWHTISIHRWKTSLLLQQRMYVFQKALLDFCSLNLFVYLSHVCLNKRVHTAVQYMYTYMYVSSQATVVVCHTGFHTLVGLHVPV